MTKLALVAFTLIVGIAQVSPLPPAPETVVDFSRDVEPILRRSCQVCHGAQQQMSGLRLDRAEDALRGGYSGPVIRPGDSTGSKLIHLVAGLKGDLNPKGIVMPPAGTKLSPKDIGVLRAWIDGGAKWTVSGSSSSPSAKRRQLTLWSVQPIKRPKVPAPRDRSWIKNPIDAFVLARLAAEGLDPSAEADKTTLIRRVTLDLIGLPPAPAEVAQYVSDTRPEAYEVVVDRLLASPHYGEKWARHWLDQARYADSDGHENDRIRPHAWRYRHWVIDALNRDMPFDQFTIEQLAGDLVPGSTADSKVATGFHRNTLVNREAGTNLEQVRFEQILDRTNTVATVWQGLTFGCAQCHDHKYDPISQKEYYQFFAFFNSSENVDIDAPLPGDLGLYLRARAEYDRKRNELLKQYRIPELQPEWEKRLIEAFANPGKWTDWDHHYSRVTLWIDSGEKILRTDPAKRSPKQRDELTEFFIGQYGEVASKKRYEELKFKELKEKLERLEADFPALSQAQTIQEDPVSRKTHIYIRGEVDAPGIEVQPATLAVLSPLRGDGKPNRLTLARWLVSKDNPLTARVMMNRSWQELFGRGIVPTSEDFGAQGEKPSHPELLDWLAAEFMERGWSFKQMHRLMVMSATYRQSSHARPALQSHDPNNVLLARQSRLRLPAEAIRDSALAASGLLDPTIGGKSVRPHQPAGATSIVYSSAANWKDSEGRDRYRRGLYIHLQRTMPYPQLINFDAPASKVTACRRERSNTPLQALNLLNDPVFFEAAQALAARTLLDIPNGNFAERLSYAFRLCLARQPTAREAERLLSSYLELNELFAKQPESIETIFPTKLENTRPIDAAVWVGISSAILNLDEFITRE